MARQRARTDEDKRARLDDILAAAGRVFDAVEFDAFTMEAVAGELGLVKGTLYRYVPTREALLLALMEDEYEAWFDAVEAGLGAAARGDTDAIVTALTDSVLERPRFMRLTTLLGTVLERNVPYETAKAFKTSMVAGSRCVAAVLAERLDIPAERAVQLLIHLQASLIGLYQHATPAPVVRQLIADGAYTGLLIDLPAELHHAVDAFVAAARRSSPPPPT